MTEQERKEFEAWVNGPDGDVITDPWALEKCWLAARRTQDAKVRELVEAVLQTNKADILDWQYVYTLATQVKQSQSDSPPQE